MFKPNVATPRYYKIVNYYLSNPPELGERHHIIPKSLGGVNSKANVVVLPVRAHYLVHVLLTRMVVEAAAKRKMAFALWAMLNPQKFRGAPSQRGSRQYEKIRDFVRRVMRENNPMHRPDVLLKVVGRARPEQAEVMRRVNVKRWAGHTKKVRVLTRKRLADKGCLHCGGSFRPQCKTSKYCSHVCSSLASSINRKGQPAHNKGKPNPTAAENGRKGAKALSEKIKGRRMARGPDGTRYWVYPGVEDQGVSYPAS